MKDQTSRRFFRHFSAGEELTDGYINKVSDALEEMTGTPKGTARPASHIRFVTASEAMGTFLHDWHDEARHNRTARLQYWDADLKELQDTNSSSNAQKQFTLSDPHGAVYGAGEKLAVVYSPHSGKHFPLNPAQIRLAMTWPDVVLADDVSSGSEPGDPGCGTITDVTYPQENDEPPPNTWPIKFLTGNFTQAAGHQAPATGFIRAGLCPDAYVLNLQCPETAPPYLPVYSLIWVFRDPLGAWFTYVDEVCDQESSSSSSVSLSSQSSSSKSSSSASSGGSSASSSSQGSSDSSSSTSSGGSSESSSGGSSASSSSLSVSASSESSVSASSISISASSGYDCVSVITGISFDSATCLFTYCTRQICFPGGLGVTIGEEVC